MFKITFLINVKNLNLRFQLNRDFSIYFYTFQKIIENPETRTIRKAATARVALLCCGLDSSLALSSPELLRSMYRVTSIREFQYRLLSETEASCPLMDAVIVYKPVGILVDTIPLLFVVSVIVFSVAVSTNSTVAPEIGVVVPLS